MIPSEGIKGRKSWLECVSEGSLLFISIQSPIQLPATAEFPPSTMRRVPMTRDIPFTTYDSCTPALITTKFSQPRKSSTLYICSTSRNFDPLTPRMLEI